MIPIINHITLYIINLKNLTAMKKKQYQTPQMKSVEFKPEQHLLAASTESFTVGNIYDDESFE